MKLSKVKDILNAQVLCGEEHIEHEIITAFASDLMSDVMAFAETQKEMVLLTGLINPQVIRTAEMLDIKAIAFVRGKEPNESMIDIAKDKNIVVFTTEHSMYIAAGLLYKAGLTEKGMRDKDE